MTNLTSTLNPTQSALLSIGVPQRYLKQTNKQDYRLDYKAILQTLDVRGVFIFGKVGTGKTQLAVDLAGDLLEAKKIKVFRDNYEMSNGSYINTGKHEEAYNPKLVKFYNMPRLLIYMRSLYNDDAEQDIEEFLEEINRYEYVVLDDIGTEKPTEWVLEMLYVLINTRYENGGKLIITSNKTLGEVAQAIGDRVASRILEMCQIIKLDGEDKRGRLV
jgi:DNA replication protein DnaC